MIKGLFVPPTYGPWGNHIVIKVEMAGGVVHNVTVAAVNHPELLYTQVTDHLMAGIEDVVGMRGRNHIRVSLALCFD